MAVGTIPNLFFGKQNYILAIGVDKYNDSGNFRQLESCQRDVKDFINILSSNYQCFKENNCKTLFNHKATKDNILTEIKNQLYKPNASEWNLIIYFAGHGDFNPRTKEGYWIPYDAKYGKYAASYIPFEKITKYIANSDIHHILLISDSCYGGTIFANYRSESVYLPKYYKIKSRWGLTSGRKETVDDGTNRRPSPFSEVLSHVLKLNAKIGKEVSVKRICVEIEEEFEKRFGEKEQMPDAQPLKIPNHKHQNGQFVFLPKHTSIIPIEIVGEPEPIKSDAGLKDIEDQKIPKLAHEVKEANPIETDNSPQKMIPINFPELENEDLIETEVQIDKINNQKTVVKFIIILMLLVVVIGIYMLNDIQDSANFTHSNEFETNQPSGAAISKEILDIYDPKQDPNLIAVVVPKPYHHVKRRRVVNADFQSDTSKKADIVFAGSFENKDNALNILAQLKKIGYQNAEIVMKENLPYMIVVTGFNMQKKEAKREVQSLQKKGIEAYHSERQADKVYRSEK